MGEGERGLEVIPKCFGAKRGAQISKKKKILPKTRKNLPSRKKTDRRQENSNMKEAVVGLRTILGREGGMVREEEIRASIERFSKLLTR